MLWTLGFYLTRNGNRAALFLPHGVYLALLILLARRYWPALIVPPILLLLWLHGERLLSGYGLLAAPFITLFPAAVAQRLWHRFPLYWQRLTLLLAAVTAASLLNTALLSPFVPSPAMLLGPASFTGGVLLTPFVYLIFEFLRQQHRYHLLGLDTQPAAARIFDHLVQPVFRYRYRHADGAVAGNRAPVADRGVSAERGDGVEVRLAGRRAVRPARQHDDHPRPAGRRGVRQSGRAGDLSGDAGAARHLPGIAISRQQHGAKPAPLSAAPGRRAGGAAGADRKLIHTEEDTRKNRRARLHDEIGQNITAIQIQSQLVKRARDPAQTRAAAHQIGELARRIHHSTRQLLRQLRPPALDELAFKEALHHLLSEFALPNGASTAVSITG